MTNVYALLDIGDQKRLEQWGSYLLVRPDPTASGVPKSPQLWKDADAVYEGEKGRGQWRMKNVLPEQWTIDCGDLRLCVRLAPYKHTGVFPEQQKNWTWMRNQAKKQGRPLRILNLFAYTGGATMALAKDGHCITHVDASKPAMRMAKENAALNNLSATAVRWILDDVPTFVARERKRGKTYDAILLDPPAYGHSTTGKTWRMERDLAPLLEACASLLSDQPSFLVLNGYAEHDTPDSFRRLLTGILLSKTPHKNFTIDPRTLVLTAKTGEVLSTGIVARCGFSRTYDSIESS